MSFLDELQQRGLYADCTDPDGLAQLLASQVVPVYAGYDPTSPSLHVGNLVPTILLKRFQLAGHKPIVLVGGATGMIGDPSGKSDERNLLDADTLATNLAGIRAQLSRLLDFDNPVTGAAMTNNYDWTRDVRYLDFLRDIGKQLTVNYMMAKDSVKNRAGETGDALILLDAKNLVVNANNAAAALLQGKSTEDLRKLFDDLVAAKDRGRIAGVIAAAREGGRQDATLSALRVDGQELACQATFTALHDGTVVVALSEHQAGISYTEFSYMLLQAYDFVELSRSHKCRLQVGGSDQYGNITAGCELSRKLGGPKLFGLTAPLLLDSTGQKMGKTSTGERIWLDAARTSPFEFYQYWFNRPDSEAPRLLRLFSLRALGEIDEVLRVHDSDRSRRHAQRELARTMTRWVHGETIVPQIETASQLIFGDTLDGLTEADLRAASNTVPTVELPRSELAAGMTLIDLLARTVTKSKGEARRLITQNGAYLNHVQIKDVDRRVTLADLATETMLVVRRGRKEVSLVRVI